MEQLKIKSLENTPVEVLHAAFLEAFSDYEVKLDMPLEKFREMMTIRDLNPNYSLGCFDGDHLVSFIICGYREQNGLRYCYDGGTGTIASHRKRGLGNKLVTELVSSFKAKKIHSFILEVLENNTAAIELYKKNGFSTTRRLCCYTTDVNSITTPPQVGSYKIKEESAAWYKDINIENYLSFKPSWQNDKASVLNVKGSYAYISVYNADKLIGFGCIHKDKGDIPQIGVLEQFRGKNVESIIVNGLKLKAQCNNIRYLNIEETDYLNGTLSSIGFTNYINQYEMILPIESA